MTQEQFFDYLANISAADLDAVKKIIADREEALYEERWWTHDKIDDYLYYVYYEDGTSWMHCIAKYVYDEYMRNDRAVMLKRKTKDLFPTWETLLEKERNVA